MIRYGRHALAGFVPTPGATRAISYRNKSGQPFGADADLYYNFAEDKSLIDRVNNTLLTLNRASNASFVDELGVIKVTTANSPRFGHAFNAPHESLGILVEGPRTNVSLQNQTMHVAPWAGSAAGTGSAPTVTANAGSAPDGQVTATRLQMDRGAGATAGDNSAYLQSITLPATISAHSLYMRSFDSNDYQIDILNPDGTSGNVVTVTPVWQRFSAKGNGTAAANNSGIRISGDLPTSQTADILVWGDQQEADAVGNAAGVSSVITTVAASVLRAQDFCQTLDMSWYNTVEGSMYGKAAMDDIQSGFDYIASITSGAGNQNFAIKTGGTGGFGAQGIVQNGVGGSTMSIADVFTDLRMKIAIRGGFNDNKMAADSILSGPTVPQDDLPAGVDRLNIGSGPTFDLQWFGHIAEYAYIGVAKSDADLIGVTT